MRVLGEAAMTRHRWTPTHYYTAALVIAANVLAIIGIIWGAKI